MFTCGKIVSFAGSAEALPEAMGVPCRPKNV